MALVNFTNLDFDQIKSSIKDYLRSNSTFTDYDFEGSNLSTIIDILAYNTYISSYNANMISNEVFIDSATLRENVVSLARNIGYIPKSRTSSRANVSFQVDTTNFSTTPISLTLQKGIVCTTGSSFSNENYSFVVLDDVTAPVVDGIAYFDDIEIVEGSFITENFTIDSNIKNQRIILSNPNIDTTSISVNIKETISSNFSRKYTLSNSIFGVRPTSRVFFIQEVEDQRYELIFGDGVFGQKLENFNYIDVSYIVSSGELANNISDFNFSGRLIDNNGRVVTNGISIVTTNSSSSGGSEIESVDSIRKFAPRLYSAQNRAVTSSDYQAIIPLIYPETESVSVFGGEEINPPRFGKVFIAIKPVNGPYVSSQIKDNIIEKLRQYSVAGIVPEIIDLKYLYIEHDSTVYYDSARSLGPSSLKTIVSNSIDRYANSTELNRFGARFKYSNFLRVIDSSDEGITSNITKVIIRRDLRCNLNSATEYEICYGNQFYVKNIDGYNIKSSGFKIAGYSQTVYLSDRPDANPETGTIFLFELLGNSENLNANIIKSNIGKIDYVKGEIKLDPIIISSTSKVVGIESIIEISAIPMSNDIIGLHDLYLQLDISKSSVNMVPDRISSGSDVSGSDYIFTSSYSNGDLVRK